MNQVNLNSFLSLGYFLDYSDDKYKILFSNVDKMRYIEESEHSLIVMGSECLRDAISNSFVSNKKHVVPISGGLDSRALLAGLLEHTNAENISTFTFGTPNTMDYEIGTQIAKKLGTKHIVYPLTDYTYTQNEMLDISKRVNQQTMLFLHGPVSKIHQQFSEHLYWSGFMGETLSGDHLPKSASNNLNQAKNSFLQSNRLVKSMNLMNIDNQELFEVLECEEINRNIITYEEQLDFHNRQTKFIAPHVLMESFEYCTPFLDQGWTDFILSVDNKYRTHQNLYKKILLNLSPYLFSLPTKGTFGRGLNDGKITRSSYRLIQKIQRTLSNYFPKVLNPHVNYINFDDGIRNREDLKKIIYENIMNLKDRRVVEWIDIDKIWFDHISNKINHADALMVLASLEIHFKTGKEL